MEKITNICLYGRVLIAFLISFGILIFLLLTIVHASIIFVAFIFPLFFISIIATFSFIFILSKKRFKKSMNKRSINILSLSIVVITILIALSLYLTLKTTKPPYDLLGDWEFEEGHNPLKVDIVGNQAIVRIKFTFDSTYNRNNFHLINIYDQSIIDGIFEYDESIKKIIMHGIHDNVDWELTLKLKIDTSEKPYRITTSYVSDEGFPYSNYFDPTMFNGLTWIKTSD